jgi:hypothetical protein
LFGVWPGQEDSQEIGKAGYLGGKVMCFDFTPRHVITTSSWRGYCRPRRRSTI